MKRSRALSQLDKARSLPKNNQFMRQFSESRFQDQHLQGGASGTMVGGVTKDDEDFEMHSKQISRHRRSIYEANPHFK
jgi:hypothetical protein